MSEIKKRIIDVISEHTEVEADQDTIIEKLIEALEYQQAENKQLRQNLTAAEQHGEMYRLRYIQLREGGEG